MRFMCLLLGSLILIQGCKNESVTDTEWPKAYPINVHFQTGFVGDSAIIMISGAFVASVDSITTNPIIVLAASRRFTIIPGPNTLSVSIPKDTVRTDTTFVHVERELWVGVNYRRDRKRIQYVFQYSPFPYR